jgi:type IV secretion system protein TrbL
MPDLLDLGWLPDAIVRAIVVFIRSVLVTVINFMFNFGLKPLLTIEPSIMTSGPVITAWDDVFRLSIALLPILIAAGLIAMPFSQDQEASLWNMVARLVAVIFFIAISQPLFGFLVEASNAVTSALAPPTFVLTFEADLGGGWGSTLGVGVEVVALLVAVILMFIATILSTVLLVLRQFIVVTVAVGAPFFAVLWFANWGPMKSISNFASTWLRMGVYALLVGPIIALVMRVFNVIGAGGISSSGDVAQFYASAALALIFPIVLFVVVWKTVGWAGQPLGVDAAFTMTVAAAIAATGVGAVAVGAGAGSAAVSGASKSSTGGASESESGGSSGGSGGGTSGGGTAADPSVGTGNSTVGGTMRSSVSDALGTRESAVEDGIDTAPSIFSKDLDYTRNKVASAPGVGTALSHAERANSVAKRLGSKTKTGSVAGVRRAIGTEGVDSHRRAISQNLDAADEADANRDFLTEAYQNGELDVPEAVNREILTSAEEPAEGISTLSPDAEGKVTYDTVGGEEMTIDLNDRAQGLGQKAVALREDASRSARSIKRIRSAQTATKAPGWAAISTGRVGKQVGKTGIQAGKAGGIVFAGAMTQSPYAAYNMGKRGGTHLIGPGTGDDLASNSDDTPDAERTVRQEEGPSQASAPPWDSDTEGEQSESI